MFGVAIVNILLIDDDEQFCKEATAYLRSQGFQVTSITDGHQALATVEEADPDIVVLDIALQKEDLNGLTLCTDIRQKPKYAKGALGIVMISGHHSKYLNWTRSLQRGADRYLVKPFELDVLTDEIKALYSTISGPKILQIANNIIIHFDDRRVTANQDDIGLTPLEYNLLEYLAKPPNKIRTRFELLETVWRDQPYTEGAVAQCVASLRAKLSPNEPDRFVKSVGGVGYQLHLDFRRKN